MEKTSWQNPASFGKGNLYHPDESVPDYAEAVQTSNAPPKFKIAPPYSDMVAGGIIVVSILVSVFFGFDISPIIFRHFENAPLELHGIIPAVMTSLSLFVYAVIRPSHPRSTHWRMAALVTSIGLIEYMIYEVAPTLSNLVLSLRFWFNDAMAPYPTEALRLEYYFAYILHGNTELQLLARRWVARSF
ncbi:MAG: hypothetical protein HQL45_14435 [Alphaproteobacteria bacterium]|nr:hypothetical protein [Alphaproteobacteria bacterium]